jgi:hypothetical protein
MRLLLAAVPLFAVAGCVMPPRLVIYSPPTVPPTFNGQAGAMSGERQRVDFVASINPDCTPAGERVDLISKPAHGSVDFAQSQEFAAFPQANPRSKCNERRIPGTSVFYTSEPGFRGVDTFTQTLLITNGQQRTTRISVTVR